MLDFLNGFQYNGSDVFIKIAYTGRQKAETTICKEVQKNHENDISAKEKTEVKSTRLSEKNEYCQRQKSISKEKSKR